MSRIRRLSLMTVLAAILVALGAPAFATQPVTTSGIVTDPGEWLSDADRTRIENAAREARSEGISVDVVIVDTFSGMDAVQWCRQTLRNSGTSDGTILYVLAYSQRQDTECVNGGSISASTRIDARVAAESKLTSKPLTASDAASGSVAFINHLVSAKKNPQQGSTRTSSSGSGTTRPSGDLYDPRGAILIIVLITVGFITAGAMVSSSSRRAERAAKASEEVRASDANAKAAKANGQLLHADEQVRTAADELDYARAQFGIAATDDFSRALDAARECVGRGFDTQKQMDASTSSTARANLAASIMADLAANMDPLSAFQASFAAKRAAQATLPARIDEANERLAEQRVDLERAKAELASIGGIYPTQMLASLQDNPEQANALLDAADAALTEAEQTEPTDRTRAESALDTAHRALMMAKHQTDAIFSAKSDLDAIHDRLAAAIGSISSDVTDVAELNATPAVFTPLVADANAAIAEGQAALLNNGDPLAALEHLRNAEANLDSALAPLRSKRDNEEKARATARSQISLAESAVDRAQRYVQGRRGAMDFTVRSTLHDSEAALRESREALEANPAEASALASKARTLADRVLATPLASPEPSYYSSSNDSSLGDHILWSILFSSNNNSRGDSSWSSGSSWSSSHHSSFGGFSGSSGSFGGGGFSGSKGNF